MMRFKRGTIKRGMPSTLHGIEKFEKRNIRRLFYEIGLRIVVGVGMVMLSALFSPHFMITGLWAGLVMSWILLRVSRGLDEEREIKRWCATAKREL
jgi:hypothetical protein